MMQTANEFIKPTKLITILIMTKEKPIVKKYFSELRFNEPPNTQVIPTTVTRENFKACTWVWKGIS